MLFECAHRRQVDRSARVTKRLAGEPRDSCRHVVCNSSRLAESCGLRHLEPHDASPWTRQPGGRRQPHVAAVTIVTQPEERGAFTRLQLRNTRVCCRSQQGPMMCFHVPDHWQVSGANVVKGTIDDNKMVGAT